MLGVILLSAAIAAGPAEPSAVVDRFVHALSAENLEAVAELMTPEGRATSAWRLLANELESYACVSVRDARPTIIREDAGSSIVDVELDATAFHRGRIDREANFPRQWRLDLRRTEGGWRLHSALIRERVIARELAADDSPTPEEIVAAAGASLPGVLLELSDELVDHTPGKHLRAALEVAEETARLHELRDVEARMVLARGHFELGQTRFAQADVFARKVLEFAAQRGDEDLAAAAGLLSGANAWASGDRSGALQRYAAVMRTVGVANDPRPAMKARYMTGLLLIRAGEVGRGLAEAARTGELIAAYAWSEGRCSTHMLQYEGYRILRDDIAARRHARAALSCAQKFGDPRLVIMATSNLTLIERAVGNRANARRLAEEIVSRPPRFCSERAQARLQLALMMTDEQRYAEAERTLLDALTDARRCNEKLVAAPVLAAIARVRLLAGDTALALAAARDANALMLQQSGGSAIGIHTGEPWTVRSIFGVALAAAGLNEEALEVLQSAVELIETQRSRVPSDELGLSEFMADKDEAYRALIAVLVSAGRIEEAVTTSERLRARALGDAVARGYVDILPAISSAERARLKELNTALAAANRERLVASTEADAGKLASRIALLRDELRAFRSELYIKHPRIQARSVEESEGLIADASRLLPDAGDAILTYVVNDRETIGFLLRRDREGVKITTRRIAVTREELERQAEEFSAAIAQRDLRYARHAKNLHHLLVAPFVRDLAGKRRLYIVPEGVLWRVPFHALIGADGRAVLETMTVAFSPSLTLLRARRPEPHGRAAGRGVLAVGDPILPRGAAERTLASLPGARDEAEQIARTYGGEGRLLAGTAATERAVKEQAANFRIIHLATHSIINDAAPMYSSIALTPSGADDGFLEAREMLELDLEAALVVLSSCESAGGALTPGEGVVGMSWALMVAGSENALVTLVDVGSRSTGRFMIELHRRIAKSDDYAASLRETQLATMRRPETSHPFYWAPYVLICTRQDN